MKNITFTNLTIFILFFAFALFESLREQQWIEASAFLTLGILCVWSDLRDRTKTH